MQISVSGILQSTWEAPLRPNPRGSHNSGFAKRSAPDWATYSRKKAEWIRANPNATAEQITKAAKEIARSLGL